MCGYNNKQLGNREGLAESAVFDLDVCQHRSFISVIEWRPYSSNKPDSLAELSLVT